ncbi:MAG: hypothetical protein WA797_03360 [Acidimicrobiales bacterium]
MAALVATREREQDVCVCEDPAHQYGRSASSIAAAIRRRPSLRLTLHLECQDVDISSIPTESGIRRSVLIEVRYKSGDWPSETKQITSLLGEALMEVGDISAYADLDPFNATCVHPGRTAIEKLGSLRQVNVGDTATASSRRRRSSTRSPRSNAALRAPPATQSPLHPFGRCPPEPPADDQATEQAQG